MILMSAFKNMRLGLAAALLALHSAASAATLVLTPSKDNTLYQDAEGDVSNGQGVFLYAGKTGEDAGFRLRRGLIAFDLTSIPPDAVISGATLTMFLSRSSPSAAPVNISLHAATQNWGEGASNAGNPGGTGAPAQTGDATWRHRFFSTSMWTTVGGDFRAAASATTSVSTVNRNYSWVSGSLTGDVQAWVSNPASNFGWFIRGDELTNESAQRFNSSESTSNRPQLTVTYTVVPEPSVAALGAIAAVVCLARRRRYPPVQ